MVAPRPTSNNSRSFPASTSVAAPNRSVVGNGVPVPSSVTLKSCAQAADVKARQADTITKRRTMPIPRLHGVPIRRAYRAMGWIAKRLAATGESVRGAVACGAGRREARHAPSVALGMISKHLGLPTDELALKLSEFLRLAHADHPLGKVERVVERFFGQEHGALANDRRLLIHAFGRLAGDHEHALESGLALAQILFGDFAHPIHAVGCRLHRSFGILLSEIRWTFGHSFRLLQSQSDLNLI